MAQMKKLFDFRCSKCSAEVEAYTSEATLPCPLCKEEMHKLPSFGGYHIRGDNSGSTRPKGAGYRKVKK